jgi:hypothetical protein
MRDESAKTVLPQCAVDYIDLVAKKVRYRRKVRTEIRQELAGHFEDAIRKCASDAERDEAARKVIADFGDPKILAKLIRRGKKRCRPLWLKALIRTCQVFGIIILLVGIRIASLFGTPSHATDFYAKLNALVRQGYEESQNAQPLLDQATAAMTPMPEWMMKATPRLPLDVNDRELGELATYLEANAKALELVQQASRMPARWITSHPGSTNPNITEKPRSGQAGVVFSATVVEQYMPAQAGVKTMAYLFRWHLLYQVYIGNTAAAFDDAMTLMRLSSLYQDKGILVDRMVGMAVEGFGHYQLCSLLATGGADAAKLKDMQAELQQLFAAHPVTLDLDGEKLFMDAQIESGYTENGRMLVGGIPMACGGLWPVVKGLVAGFPSKAEIQSTVESGYARVEEISRRTPWQRHANAQSITPASLKSTGLLMQVVVPAFEKTAEINWRARAGRGATLAILAIELYRLEKGSLPASLDELVKSGYLTELPMDPWSDGLLVYRRIDDGYTLYGVGEDFTDNGGKPRPKDLRERAKGGWDDVFWPAQ